MTELDIKYLIHKRKIKRNKFYNGESQLVAMLEPKIVKIKGISKGYNLPKAH